MITREDFDKSHFKGDWETCYDLAVELLKERDALAALKEAYREVANKYRALWVSEGRYSDDSVASQVVDSEAERIMKEKGGV